MLTAPIHPVKFDSRPMHSLAMFALLIVASILFGCLPIDALAQTSLDSTPTGIDTAICSFLKLMQKFGFYVLLFSIVLVALLLKLGEGRDLVVKGIQIIGGVWLLLNVIAIGDTITAGRLSSAFSCTLY